MSEEPSAIHVDWTGVQDLSRELGRRLTERGPWTGVVAVTRGGLIPAAIVARALGVRLVETLGLASYEGRERGALKILKLPELAAAAEGEGWLVIDDLVDSGETLRKAREVLPRARYAVLYAKPDGLDAVDDFIVEAPQSTWIFFPWETDDAN
ncbi:MAG: xanthine phosphoribosyltransferase [Alphaproteobacteria bacterium]|nr:xanthine phosphoribosyltransferase [Alphaproteobacteria bacterium]